MAAFATGVPPDIYEFHLYTWNSAILSWTLVMQYRMQFLGWAQGFHTRLAKPPTPALRPIIPNNACTLRITAAAGTELAGAYSSDTLNFPRRDFLFSDKRGLQPRRPSSLTRHGWFRLASIDQYSLLLPPVGVWSVSQYQCGGSSSQTR